MKLVLFDVDGTILSASGAGRRALGRALRDVYGCAGPIETYDFHGGTDPRIVRDLLTAAGVSEAEIARHEGLLYARYVEHLRTEIGDGRGIRLYPGVAELVGALARSDTCVLGLLTGNIEAGARLKLHPTGLLPRFRVGAYGSDHPDRTRLPAVAARRAEALTGCAFAGPDLVIVGDTPRDVACAQAFGARCLAVATGRHSVADLQAAGADTVVPDLTDTADLVAVILDGT